MFCLVIDFELAEYLEMDPAEIDVSIFLDSEEVGGSAKSVKEVSSMDKKSRRRYESEFLKI